MHVEQPQTDTACNDPHMAHRHAWHGHQAGDADRPHHLDVSRQSFKRLFWAILITSFFALTEIIGGIWSGSLALLSDAGHMLTDVAALGLALGAQWLGRRPANQDWSFGLARAEVLAAFLNSVAMLGLIIWIAFEASQRLLQPEPIASQWVMGIATLGLCSNALVYWLLHSPDADANSALNRRAALVHVLGDLLGSVAALFAGAIIYFTGWLIVDPVLSMLICALLLRSTLDVLRESGAILLEAVPRHIAYADVAQALQNLPGVHGVHDLHIWNMAANRPALIAHLQIAPTQDWAEIINQARILLKQRFGITHVTLQPEFFAGEQGAQNLATR